MFAKFDIGDVIVNIHDIKNGLVKKYYIYEIEEHDLSTMGFTYVYKAKNKNDYAVVRITYNWEIYNDFLIDKYAEYLI